MKIVSLKKVIQAGVHRVEKGKVADVPDALAQSWIANQWARQATAAEVKAFDSEQAKAAAS